MVSNGSECRDTSSHVMTTNDYEMFDEHVGQMYREVFQQTLAIKYGYERPPIMLRWVVYTGRETWCFRSMLVPASEAVTATVDKETTTNRVVARVREIAVQEEKNAAVPREKENAVRKEEHAQRCRVCAKTLREMLSRCHKLMSKVAMLESDHKRSCDGGGPTGATAGCKRCEHEMLYSLSALKTDVSLAHVKLTRVKVYDDEWSAATRDYEKCESRYMFLKKTLKGATGGRPKKSSSSASVVMATPDNETRTAAHEPVVPEWLQPVLDDCTALRSDVGELKVAYENVLRDGGGPSTETTAGRQLFAESEREILDRDLPALVTRVSRMIGKCHHTRGSTEEVHALVYDYEECAWQYRGLMSKYMRARTVGRVNVVALTRLEELCYARQREFQETFKGTSRTPERVLPGLRAKVWRLIHVILGDADGAWRYESEIADAFEEYNEFESRYLAMKYT